MLAGMRVCAILTTYNQPAYLDLCLFALSRQRHRSFEVIVADDGSRDDTRAVVDRYQGQPDFTVRHVWQEDRGFRKTRILNKAVRATTAEYLIFTDGDCILAPDFIDRHLEFARPGRFLTGSIIRLGKDLSPKITRDVIDDGRAFEAGWLARSGKSYNRRYLRLTLPLRARESLDRFTTTKPHWMGSNSSCFREDALAVNGFDHRFSYGFEDADFGIRLMNLGRQGRNVRWTANALHLYHDRPYVTEGMREENRRLVPKIERGGKTRVENGIAELDD
jgi:glycosyltransferase involved in cell wall biosynthesis